MKKCSFVFASILLALPPLIAQVSNPSIIVVSSAPSGSCGGSGLSMQYVFSTGVLYACQNGTWGQIGGGGGGGPYLSILGGTMTGPAYMDGPIYDARAVGLKCDMVTDDTAALNAADTTLQTNGGGTIRFPPHSTCLIAGHIVLPNDNTEISGGGSAPYSRQVPIRWEGTQPDIQNGQRQPPSTLYTGSMLKMTYSGTGATGGLLEQSVYAGGSGYVVGDTGTVGGTCSGTTYTVEAIDTGTYLVGTAGSTLTHTGYVEQVYISADGSACTVADNVATSTGGAQPGSGTGLTLNLAAVSGGAFAKIETYGVGTLEIDHLTLYDPGSDSLPFLRTTGTTLHFHDSYILGTGSTQDALVLGGTSYAFNTLNSPLAAFQGYDTTISENVFEKIRRAEYTQLYNAAALTLHNIVDAASVSDIPEGAAIESNNPLVDSVSGVPTGGSNGGENFYAFNRVEMSGYPYAYKFFSSGYNHVSGTDIEDVNTGSVTPYGVISYTGASKFNFADIHISEGLPPVIADASSSAVGALSNTLISTVPGTSSSFPSGASMAGGSTGVTYVTPGDLGAADYSFAAKQGLLATSSTNQGIGRTFESIGQVWNGSASSPDKWYWSHSISNGTNGASSYTLNHSGSTGTAIANFQSVAMTLPGATVTAGSGGAWTFANQNSFNGSNLFNTDQVIRTTTAATSGANQTSHCLYFYATIWTGAASTLDQWCIDAEPAAGTEPTVWWTIKHFGGSTGYLGVKVAENLQVTGAVQNGTTTATNSDNRGKITLSSGTGSYTFTQGPGAAGIWTTAPICVIMDDTTPGNIATSTKTVSTSTLTITGSVGTSDVYSYVCWAGN